MTISTTAYPVKFSISQNPRYRIFAWFQLSFALLVILGGAFVRATGSGAGCGEHWPLCNGTPIPLNPSWTTLIEFSHRLTSGLLGLISLGQWIYASRRWPKGEKVRFYAGLSLVFVIIEALIGAVIVRLGLVAADSSSLRAFWVSGHLLNTMLLVAVMAIHAWFASGYDWIKLAAKQSSLFKLSIGFLLLTSASGAVVALGDTLFPAENFSQAFAQKNDPSAHFLIQLRWYHPLLAMLTALLVMGTAFNRLQEAGENEKYAAWFCIGCVVFQFIVGMVNMLLLVPIPLQLLHLLVANILWLSVWRLKLGKTN